MFSVSTRRRDRARRASSIDHVLEHRAEASRRRVDLRLGLGGEADHLRVAAALEVEDAVVAPAMLVVADQVPLRDRPRASSCPCRRGRRRAPTLPWSPTFAEQCIGSTPSSGSRSFITREDRFLDLARVPGAADQHLGARRVEADERLAARAVLGRVRPSTAGACRMSASGSCVAQLDLGRLDEERLREQRVPGAVGDDADAEAVRRVGARERVDDVEVAPLEVRDDLLAQALEMLLGDLRVDVAPPDAPLRAGLADDELVHRRAARVPARVDDQRPAFGEVGVALHERVLVEQRRGRLPVHAAAGGDSVLLEANAGLGIYGGGHRASFSGSRVVKTGAPVSRRGGNPSHCREFAARLQ